MQAALTTKENENKKIESELNKLKILLSTFQPKLDLASKKEQEFIQIQNDLQKTTNEILELKKINHSKDEILERTTKQNQKIIQKFENLSLELMKLKEKVVKDEEINKQLHKSLDSALTQFMTDNDLKKISHLDLFNKLEYLMNEINMERKKLDENFQILPSPFHKSSALVPASFAITNFKVGDVMLFILNSAGFYEAYSPSNPHYFLSEESLYTFQSKYKRGDPALGQVVEIMERETSKSNPFLLSPDIKKYFVVHVSFHL